jgi:hypothetical protein
LRIGVDRDEDGFFDRDEIDAGSDPADPSSIPGGGGAGPIDARKLLIKNKVPDDESANKIVFLSKDLGIVPPARDSAGDPRCGSDPSGTVKASLEVRSDASGESHQTDLPCQNWTALGSATSPKGYRYNDTTLAAGTARLVLWKLGQLKATLLGRGTGTLDFDLQPSVSQGSTTVLFQSPAGDLCALCPPFAGKDGSDGKTFLGKSCSAPPSCS